MRFPSNIYPWDFMVTEKEDEFVGVKKNMTKAIEGMQSALEAESKAKAEANRMKKKLEADIRELEISLDRVGRDNVELQTKIKNQSTTMREMSQQIHLECDEKQKLKEIVSRDTRTIKILRKELEDANSLHSDADKSRRQASTALEETNDILGEMTKTRDELLGHKRKLESSVAILETELEEILYRVAASSAAAGGTANISEDWITDTTKPAQ